LKSQLHKKRLKSVKLLKSTEGDNEFQTLTTPLAKNDYVHCIYYHVYTSIIYMSVLE